MVVRMKASLDHLPQKQQDELARVRSTLLNAFETALKAGGGGTSDWRRNGQILKIILFGSYARTDWVDEPDNGYLSDFDILVIVNHEKLTDIADYWWVAEDTMLHDPAIGRTVNVIVHTLSEVNQALTRGEYFWTDIQRDGVILYELPGHALTSPQPRSASEAADSARMHFEQWISAAGRFLKLAVVATSESHGDVEWRRNAAFNLHQAVEASYACFLLVQTFYFPRSHNIKFLRSLAEDADKALAAAWPRQARADRRRFELLKRAYVEARYSDQFDVTAEDLDALLSSARTLRDLVDKACKARLAELTARATP